MRLKNVNMLAKSKVKRYKRRTLLMIAPMGLFFGVIMALLLVFVSLKATAFREMDKVSSDIYIDIYDESNNTELLKERIESMGGEVLTFDGGYYNVSGGIYLVKDDSVAQIYQNAAGLSTYPKEITEKFVTEDYSQDQVPILIPIDGAATLAGVPYDADDKGSFEKVYKDAVGKEFTLNVCNQALDEDGMPYPLDEPGGLECIDEVHYKIVGIMPSFSAWAEKNAKFHKSGFFNGMLSTIGSSYYDRYVLADETDELNNKYSKSNNNQVTIAKFKKYGDAVAFKDKFACEDRSKECDIYNAKEYFGNRFTVSASFDAIMGVFGGAIVVLVVVAMIALAVNITKIIDDEAQLINLYKIVGASKNDVVCIYASYIAKVTLYTVILSILVSLVVATILFLIGLDDLLTGFSFMYTSSVTQAPVSSIKYAVDWSYMYVILGILLSGVVGLGFSVRKLRKM